ncbi:MAG: acyltransferase family protein [Phycisphaera sp.]|nr:acyltransferase family protein [Phycisphaera sp.]
MNLYRPEVDGLRALAVVPVILFHAGVPGFAGGFVGVDVFFVISGYLIASIIHEEILDRRFSVVTFLERRARRIIPALYAVLIVTLLLGWLFMLPDNFENLGQSVVATVGVSNNILLWLTSGYWDLANEYKPLLHTWSLGVEEQFYFVFPFVLLWLAPRGRRTTLIVFAIVAVASLAAAQWFVMCEPLAAFFLLPMRAWELLMGAMFAVTCRRDRGHALQLGAAGGALAWLGLALILAPVVLYDATTPFPGLAALPPTLGTLLVIMFASEANVVGRLLSWRVLVAIGLGSYSAYLWHQPIFAFLRLLSPEHPSAPAVVLAIVATAVLSYASWRFIEQPFRSRERFSRTAVFTLTISVGGLLAGAGFAVDRSSGFPERLPYIASATEGGGRAARRVYIDRVYALRSERFSESDARKVLLLGNSFARDFVNMVTECGYMKSSEISYEPITEIGMFSCVRDMERFPESLRERLRTCDVLILVMPIFDPACMAEDIAWLREQGVPQVIVIGTKNFGANPNSILGMSLEAALSYRARVLPEVLDANRVARELVPEDCFVDLLAILADEEGRVPLLDGSGKLLSEDGGHLTLAGARFVGERLFAHPLLAPLRD